MGVCSVCGSTYDPHVRICPRDGTILDSEDRDDALAGRVLDNRYRLDAIIGEGGMGTVYRATHLMLNKTVAVKVIHAQLVASSDIVRRFQREARAASSLIHPNIAAAYDLGQGPDGTLYIAMEFVSGVTLKDVVRREGRLEEKRVRHLIGQVASALSAAHHQQIVHRDLKPQNVMVTTDRAGREVAKLLDFGIAKTFDGATQITNTGLLIGTPAYMSPEQVSGDVIDARSDLYSLGVILYEMLTGDVPFNAPTPAAVMIKHLNEAPRRPSERRPDANISGALEEIALRCLEKRAADRFQSADQLIDALDAPASPPAVPAPAAAGTATSTTVDDIPIPVAKTVAVPDAAAETPQVEAGILAPTADDITIHSAETVAVPPPSQRPAEPIVAPELRPAATVEEQGVGDVADVPARGKRLTVPLIVSGLGGAALLVVIFSAPSTGDVEARVPIGCTATLGNLPPEREGTADAPSTFSAAAGTHTLRTACPDGRVDERGVSVLSGATTDVTVTFPQRESTIDEVAGCKTEGYVTPAISTGGRYVAYLAERRCNSGAANRIAELVDRLTGERLTFQSGGNGPLYMTPNGSHLAVWTPESIVVHDVSSRTSTTLQLSLPPNNVLGAGLELSDDGRVVVYALVDTRPAVWVTRLFWADLTVQSRHEIGQIRQGAIISRDGRFIAYIDLNQQVNLFDRTTGRQRALGVASLGWIAFVDDDHGLAFTSRDRYSPDDRDSETDVYVVDLANGSISRHPALDHVDAEHSAPRLTRSGGVLVHETAPQRVPRLLWFDGDGSGPTLISTQVGQTYNLGTDETGAHVVAVTQRANGESGLLLIDRPRSHIR